MRLSDDVRQIVKRYKKEIEATARVRRAKDKARVAAYRSYMDDRNIDAIEGTVEVGNLFNPSLKI